MLDQNSSGRISFSEYLTGVSIFKTTNRAERLYSIFQMCLSAFPTCDNISRITHNDLYSLITIFDRLINGHRASSIETELFVKMVMERNENRELTYEEFSQIIILHPIVSNIFRLDVLT